ncbi:MAG: family 10 glycosylhydrolase [Armatimonadetes bacterium]|nr:family 10 glycosylhydrolase [Armatimonadota bacterium]
MPDRVVTGLNRDVEVRALWVVRFTITSPEACRRAVALAKENGFNTLIVQVRGRGDAFYNNGLEPRTDSLDGQPPEFDPLALLVEEGHAAGLSVHAWLNVHYTWGLRSLPRWPEHIVNRRPDWLAVTRDGRVTMTAEGQTEGAYTCPSNPEVKAHIASVFLDVARRYDVEGIHFDFVRYPSSDYCFCPGCLGRFRAHLKESLPPDVFASLSDSPDRLTFPGFYPGAWNEWRRSQITDLVRRVYREAKEVKPNLTVSAAVFANAQDAYTHRAQDWKRWLREGLLDVLCPMAYNTKTEIFARQIKDAVSAAGGRPVWAGLGAWQMPADSAIEKIERARALKARGIVLFSYGGVTKEGKSDAYLKQVQERCFQEK